ncbi:TPA: hypothetical protein ACQ283_005380, partial [Klebsiella pneumoniae]
MAKCLLVKVRRETSVAVFRQCEIREKYLAIYKESFDEVITYLEKAGALEPGALRLTTIDDNAIRAWKSQWKGRSRKHAHGAWDWQNLASKRARSCKRFDVAVWGEDVLCGLSVGKLTRGKKTVRMDYLEACPTAHPLEKRITMIVVAVALSVAKKVGAQHVAIFNPIKDKEEKVLKHYQSYGFTQRMLYGRFLKNVLYKEVV